MHNQQKIDIFFQNLDRRLNAFVDQLPTIVGNEAINHALYNFDNESWEGQQWQGREDKKNTSKLLVRRGRLRRTPFYLHPRHRGVTIGTTVPYAAIHNYGGDIHRAAHSEYFSRNRVKKGKHKGRFAKGIETGKRGYAVGSYTIHIPKRQFLGDSPQLREILRKAILQEYRKFKR